MVAKVTESAQLQIALISKDIAQIQKDIASMLMDIKSFKDSRYVNRDEVQVMVTESNKVQGEQFKAHVDPIKDEVKGIKQILWLIFSTFIVILIGAFARTVLKV